MNGVCGGVGKSSKLVAVVVAAVFLACSASFAELKSGRHAERAVKGWLAKTGKPFGKHMRGPLKRTETFADEQGDETFHVVYLEPSGFVIVPADDGVEPIIAFSAEGEYDPSPDSPLNALIVGDIPERVHAARWRHQMKMGDPEADARESAAREDWQILMAADPVLGGTSLITDVRRAPLVQSKWDQTTVRSGTSRLACYNYYTPPNAAGSTSNYPAGCVATAMSQLMRFYKYPTGALAPMTFSIRVNGASQTRATVSLPLSWDNMPLAPNSTATTLEQRQLIGGVLHDSGLSVNMQYASGGSGASLYTTATQLVKTWGYKNAIYFGGYATSMTGDIQTMLNTNLDANCPVLLGIDSSGASGHAIVCDGYGLSGSTWYHHLNMGWSGASDMWYNLPNVDSGYYTFNRLNSIVYNIFPQGSGEIISGRVTDAAGAPVTGVAMACTAGTFRGTATTDNAGIYAFCADPFDATQAKRIASNTTYTVSAAKAGYAFTTRTVTTGLSQSRGTKSGNVWSVDFVATGGGAAPVTISGTVKTAAGAGLAGVTVSAGAGNPAATTDAAGAYSLSVPSGWSGAITPSLAGYAFTPASQTVSNATANQSINFTASPQAYTLSGVVTLNGAGLANVAMTGLPGNPVTNAQGAYSASVAHGWSGTVTPVLAGHTFTPASKTYSNVTAGSVQNYTAAVPATSYTISGTVTLNGAGLANVVMGGLPGNPATNAQGAYSATVAAGWSGTVKPALSGYTFTPASKAYSNVSANSVQNYTATAAATTGITISGTVTYNGAPLAGVSMQGLPGTPVTDAQGRYSATISKSWLGLVRPTLAGYSFSPSYKVYFFVSTSSVQNYTATK